MYGVLLFRKMEVKGVVNTINYDLIFTVLQSLYHEGVEVGLGENTYNFACLGV